mmetsp:Transcript_6068/g.13219  ORF Transcript_6068/g.13219 Transcript_6068/m.13219 type:complete len:335 (+) Transcript_6068:66-1070(+)
MFRSVALRTLAVFAIIAVLLASNSAFLLKVVSSNALFQPQQPLFCSHLSKSSTSTSTSSYDQTAGLNERTLKYLSRYRFVPAAPRYDYNPYPAPICGEAPHYDGFFALGGDQRSRLNEDKFVYDTFFKGRTNMTGPAGTFVELGAYNGLQESNSHFFDKCLGWEGLLVEGNPISYQSVISNREFSHKMSFAPSCREDTTIQFSRYPMTNAGLKGHAKTYDDKPMVDVPCGPFGPVLVDVFGGRPVNFFSLDVEGSEMLVLTTIDFQKIHIDVFMIEIQNNHCNSNNCAVRKLVREKMKSEGYKRYEGLVHASDLYVHPDSIFQIPAELAHTHNA